MSRLVCLRKPWLRSSLALRLALVVRVLLIFPCTTQILMFGSLQQPAWVSGGPEEVRLVVYSLVTAMMFTLVPCRFGH